MAYFRCIEGKNSPTPGPTGYDYYVENIALPRQSCISTEMEIFNTTNRTRSWQIDFKMETTKNSEAPFFGTTTNKTTSNLEVYSLGASSGQSGIYLRDYIASGTLLSQDINNKDVTVLYNGTDTFTFKVDGVTIDTFVCTNFSTGTYNPGYLYVGKYVGANTYYFNGYCYYFGFKWLS